MEHENWTYSTSVHCVVCTAPALLPTLASPMPFCLCADGQCCSLSCSISLIYHISTVALQPELCGSLCMVAFPCQSPPRYRHWGNSPWKSPPGLVSSVQGRTSVCSRITGTGAQEAGCIARDPLRTLMVALHCRDSTPCRCEPCEQAKKREREETIFFLM